MKKSLFVSTLIVLGVSTSVASAQTTSVHPSVQWKVPVVFSSVDSGKYAMTGPDGTVYFYGNVSNGMNQLYAVFAVSSSGHLKWTNSDISPDEGVSFLGKNLYNIAQGQNGTSVNLISQETGHVLRSMKFSSADCYLDSVNRQIYSYTNGYILTAYDPNFRKVWSQKIADNTTAGQVTVLPAKNGNIIVVNGKGPKDQNSLPTASLSEYSPSGKKLWTLQLDSSPYGIADNTSGETVDEDNRGNTYVATVTSVYCIAPNGTVSWQIPIPQNQNFTEDSSLIYGADNNVYVTLPGQNAPWQVWSFAPSGKVNWKLPLPNSRSSTNAWSLTVDKMGHVYASEVPQEANQGNSQERIVSITGGKIKWVKTYPIQAQMSNGNPQVDSSGNVFSFSESDAKGNSMYVYSANGSIEGALNIGKTSKFTGQVVADHQIYAVSDHYLLSIKY